MKKTGIYFFGFLACLGLMAAGGDTPADITLGDAVQVWTNFGGAALFAVSLFIVGQLSTKK